MKLRYFALLFVLVLILLAGCGARTPELPAAPQEIYVLDSADVLTAQTEADLIARGEAFCAQTTAQVVVLCVRDTGGRDIEQYAKDVFNAWGIGDKEKDNGLLILLSIDADDYWVTEGRGLEDLLPSGQIKLILDEYLEPHFAAGDYDAGVRAVTEAFYNRLAEYYEAAA